MGFVVLLLILLYALYLLGWIPVSTKRASSFVGSGGGNGRSIGASFTSCTGQIHRIIRFRESRSYSFHLSGHVQQGTVSAWILDRHKQQVLRLNMAEPSAILSARKGERYYLYIRFESASGDYQLDWT